MKIENFRHTPTKEFFPVNFHGDNRTAVESISLGTISVWLYDHPTWVLDSPVTLYVNVKGNLRCAHLYM